MFSRKTVGWNLANNMHSVLVVNALNKVIEQSPPQNGSLFVEMGASNLPLMILEICSQNINFCKV